MAMRADVEIGTRFGRWTVIGPAPNRRGAQYLTCRCDCGTVREVSFGWLSGRKKSGQVVSCGCVQKAPPLIRFWRRVEIQPDGCWLWHGSLNQYGYAQFSDIGTHGVLAHRWAYEQFVGPIPEDEQIDHLCRNRACVNPNHLRTATLHENLLCGLRNNQHQQRSHCRQGHEYTPENTEMTESGIRRCRTCRKEYQRRAGEAW